MNVIGGMAGPAGLDVKELMREVMNKLEMENMDKIMGESLGTPQPGTEGGGQQAIMQAIIEQLPGGPAPGSEAASKNQKRGGSNLVSPKAQKQGDPEAQINNITPEGPGGA